MSEGGTSVLPWTPPERFLYPERADTRDTWLDQFGTTVEGWFRAKPSGGRCAAMARRVAAHAAEFARLSDPELQAAARLLRARLRQFGLARRATPRAFALVREAAHRTVGLRAFDVQVMGAAALLDGRIAEMETGEGKTLTGCVAAATAGLAGEAVHVITVNDYLAERDAAWMAPVYGFLGLTVGRIVHGMEPDERRRAYAADVTYCANKEVAFDYLRDRLVLGARPGNLHLKVELLSGEDSRTRRLLLRGLRFAIVDEADSVLIDEARTPLVLSGQGKDFDEAAMAREALAIAEGLTPGDDYRVETAERRVELSDHGKARLDGIGEARGGGWSNVVLREEMVRNAIAAQRLFRRDEHYLVRDGAVQIIDEYTGRIMADRSWAAGLHQLIEAKEGCPLTPRKVTLAQMTYQRFFRRYRHLSGMTGTASEVAGELWSVYRLPVVTIPTNRPVRRHWRRDRVERTAAEKWRRIAERVAALQAAGRPVLVGTRSVGASEEASRHLTAAGIAHRVLSAAQDADEARIVAEAGEPGRVTIATNMAGRGTDIKISPEVAAAGGLHVIISERHDAKRIDRQLAGRCGRQGDPGSVEAVLSLEDSLLDWVRNGMVGRAAFRLRVSLPFVGKRSLFDRAQRRAERTHSKVRRRLLKMDTQLGKLLAFAGPRE